MTSRRTPVALLFVISIGVAGCGSEGDQDDARGPDTSVTTSSAPVSPTSSPTSATTTTTTTSPPTTTTSPPTTTTSLPTTTTTRTTSPPTTTPPTTTTTAPPTSLAPPRPPAPSIRATDLSSLTYVVDCPAGEGVALSPTTGAVGGVDATVDIFEIVAYGDVNGEGTEDAAVWLTCVPASGGLTAVSNVVVVEATSDGPRQLGPALEGSSPRLEGATVVVQRYEYLPDDPRCCPSINFEARFRWDGSAWVAA